MCGIGAVINGNVQNLEDLMEPVRNRGETFNENITLDDSVALACNRLKIVDEENGKQPQANENDTVYAVFNGEVYNFLSLRKELEKKGHTFRTHCDTEVLVHGYEEWGIELPKHLDGQFAFVVFDKNKNKFLAARDHFGVKPLHCARNGSTVYFASEAKQVIGLSDRIEIVQPGYVIINDGARRYYQLPAVESKESLDEIVEKIRHLFDESVRKRVQTHLPVAVFLSGGVDSTAVLATARKFHPDITAIVMGNIEDSEFSDVLEIMPLNSGASGQSPLSTVESGMISEHAQKPPYCQKRQCNMPPSQRAVFDASVALKYCKEQGIPFIHKKAPSEAELFELVPKIVKITESFEPNMIKQATLSYYLAQLAKKHGFKASLCGEGADEIFAGYPEFLTCSADEVKQRSYDFFRDLHMTQLQRVDRASMYHTLEVRVPFLDKEFVEYCINLPPELKVRDGITKWILREAMRDRLPGYTADRKKVVLSEGMGLKGNSLENGLFTELASAQISDAELHFYQRNFPRYRIQTKEEAYYFRYYLQAGYAKIAFSGRPLVNRHSSVIR